LEKYKGGREAGRGAATRPVNAATITMSEEEVLRDKLTALRRGELPPQGLFGFVLDLGYSNLREAEQDVVKLLRHPSDQIRSVAVRVLAFHWDMKHHKEDLIRILVEDLEDSVRGWAAAGLGSLFSESRDPSVTRALIEKLRDQNESDLVRETAYDALLGVWFPRDVNQLRKEIVAMIDAGKARRKDLRDASARSREEYEGKLWLYEQETELKIDWDVVGRIEDEMVHDPPSTTDSV
jgi:HEAT repeat protein